MSIAWSRCCNHTRQYGPHWPIAAQHNSNGNLEYRCERVSRIKACTSKISVRHQTFEEAALPKQSKQSAMLKLTSSTKGSILLTTLEFIAAKLVLSKTSTGLRPNTPVAITVCRRSQPTELLNKIGGRRSNTQLLIPVRLRPYRRNEHLCAM